MASQSRIQKRAMTLVEVMVSVAAGSIILTSLMMIYLAGTRMSSAAIAQLAVQAKARQGLDAITYDVKRSERAVIYSSYQGASTFTSSTNSDSGAYIIFQLSTNVLNGVSDQRFHHYYIGSLKSLGGGVTNGTLYYFNCAQETNLTTKSTDVELVRGVTNPDYIFDWINGVVNINMRVADENDVDGKQIIYLRSAVAFRNGD